MALACSLGACSIDAPTYYQIDAQTGDGLLIDAAPINASPDAQLMLQHRLFVAGLDSLRAYDLDTEAVDPTSVALAGPPTDMAALDDGTIVVQSEHELLFVNGVTMTERARLPMGETLLRGVVSPLNSGERRSTSQRQRS